MPFPPNVFIRVMLIAALAVSSSCASLKKVTLRPNRKATDTPKVVRQKVGTIMVVNEAERFVLIDTGVAPMPPAGTALKSFSGEISSGVLAVGNVNRRPFVVADIVQGTPKKGDDVFQ